MESFSRNILEKGLENQFLRVLEIAKKKKSKKLFEKLGWAFGREHQNDTRIAEFIESAYHSKMSGAIESLSNVTSPFHGYSASEVAKESDFLLAIDRAFRLQSAKALHNLLYWGVETNPPAVRKKYARATRFFFEKLIDHKDTSWGKVVLNDAKKWFEKEEGFETYFEALRHKSPDKSHAMLENKFGSFKTRIPEPISPVKNRVKSCRETLEGLAEAR